MNRPDFLTTPGVWVRASRTAQTAADYASPVEHHASHNVRAKVRVIVCVLACIAIGALLALGSRP